VKIGIINGRIGWLSKRKKRKKRMETVGSENKKLKITKLERVKIGVLLVLAESRSSFEEMTFWEILDAYE
jgi:hypothetical protein